MMDKKQYVRPGHIFSEWNQVLLGVSPNHFCALIEKIGPVEQTRLTFHPDHANAPEKQRFSGLPYDTVNPGTQFLIQAVEKRHRGFRPHQNVGNRFLL